MYFIVGVRIIILNAESFFGYPVMQQAHEFGMTGAGWAWVVTDGSTGSVSLPNMPNTPYGD
jgi:hypothetical protein